MSTPGFPRHPESVPPRIAYTPGHRQWLDETRVKRQRMAALQPLVNRKAWWNVIKALLIPLIGAGAMVWLLADHMPSSVADVTTLEAILLIVCLAGSFMAGVYAYGWQETNKARIDWALTALVGTVNGALIAVAGLIMSVLPSV